jgi:hypothetical protein
MEQGKIAFLIVLGSTIEKPGILPLPIHCEKDFSPLFI